MNKKNSKIISLIIFSLLISFLTYKICYFIAEKYFFDKFFYQKNTNYGYWIPNKKLSYQDFGDRAKDLLALDNKNLKADPYKYNIVVFGDSHLWGQGIKNEQRFAKLLEDKLNKFFPTKVYSFGKPGNDIIDYRNFLVKTQYYFTANLYIVLPVDNDALINSNHDDSTILSNCQKEFPKLNPIFTPKDYEKVSNQTSYLEEQISLSWQNQMNVCVVDKSLQFFPVNKTIFLIDKNYNRDNPHLKIYQQLIFQNGQYQISTEVGKFMNKYRNNFNKKVYSNFQVSHLDPHPNALANQMYADILFDEIITNSKWGFVE